MENTKYRLVKEKPTKMFGKTLYPVEALKDFGVCYKLSDIYESFIDTEYDRVICGFWVKEGDYGGYIESESNLSAEGNSWVGSGAAVFEQAVVSDDAWIHGGNSELPTVSVRGNAEVFGLAEIKDFAQVRDNAVVCGTAVIKQYARVEDCAHVSDGEIGGNTWILGDTVVSGNNVVLDFNARPSRIGSDNDLKSAISSVEAAKQSGSSLNLYKK